MIHINNNLKFDYHVNRLCKKASKKPHDLARIANYTDIKVNESRYKQCEVTPYF